MPPLFCGWAAQRDVSAGTDALALRLLARRRVGRPGRRLWARGCDAQGNAANCVATEQTLLRAADGALACHVSIRGSVPLLWAQQPDLSPKPRLRLASPDTPGPAWAASLAAYRTHMAQLRLSYDGPVAALSLLRHRGREAPLADAFQAASGVASGAGDAHLAFDFNAQQGAAPKGRAALLALLRPHLQAQGVFARGPPPGGVTRRQKGVLRVNCLDVLDRTNMAQMAAATEAAIMQLRALKQREAAPAEGAKGEAAQQDDEHELPPALEAALGAMWRSHGDALAQQYTRTGAQRRDRSAPPSLAAALAAGRDLLISLRRYVQNNHGDGAACDAAALLSGAHVPVRSGVEQAGSTASASASSPFPRGVAARLAHAGRRAPLLQAALLLCVGRAAQALRGLAQLTGDLGAGTAGFAFWATAAMLLGHVAVRHGAAFVARPLFALDAETAAR